MHTDNLRKLALETNDGVLCGPALGAAEEAVTIGMTPKQARALAAGIVAAAENAEAHQ